MFNWRAQCVGISREGFTLLFEGEFQNKQEEIIKNPAYLSRKFPSFVSPLLGQAVFSPLNLLFSFFRKCGSDVTFYWSGVICIGGRWTESCAHRKDGADDLFIFESKSERIFREGETAGAEEEPSRSLDLSFSPAEPRGRWCASPSN